MKIIDTFLNFMDWVLGYKSYNKHGFLFYHYYQEPIFWEDYEVLAWGHYFSQPAQGAQIKNSIWIPQIFSDLFRQKKFVYHRENGPAYTRSEEVFTGGDVLYKKWYLSGRLHRMDGPAIEDSSGAQFWYQNGQLHRSNGPAIISACNIREWWLRGERVTAEEVWEQLSPRQKEQELWRINEWRD